ncbi:MAG: EamA family transporter [Candidatus Marinimicrobia bacterium]|nr:EamA family transporter [Candidatus Neomarinimicrobiota bacterium]
MKHSTAVFCLIFTGLLWSLAGVLIKSIPWPPLAIAGLRSGLAALTMLVYLKRPVFTWSKYQIGAAVAYAATVTLFVIANKLTTAGNAILLQYTAPVYVALMSYSFLGERSTKVDWLAIIFMLTGLVLFFLDDLTTAGYLGNVCAIAAGVAFAVFTVLLRKQKNASPGESILLGNILTLIIGLPAIMTSVTWEIQPWIFTFILGIFQLGIPYILFTIAIKHVTALDAIIYPTIEPIINPVLVYVFIGESLGHWAVWGGALVLGGVIFRGIVQKVKQ